MAHFDYLKTEFPGVHEAAQKAEAAVMSDPRASAFYTRRTLELAVQWAFKHDKDLNLPYQDNLSALIHDPSFQNVCGEAIFQKAKVLTRLGNLAVHSQKPIRQYDAVQAVKELIHFANWFYTTYARDLSNGPPAFNVNLLPNPSSESKQSAAQLKRLEEKLHEKDEKLSEILKERNNLDDQLANLRLEITKIKKANAKTSKSDDYNEEETRDYFIDVLLKEAGWTLENDGHDTEYPVTGMPNESGDGFVDYVLWGDDGKPLGLVEAKRTRRDPRVGQQQAKLYADCLEKMHDQRPVIFYSNGYDHFIWDDCLHPPRAIQGFFKKDELQLALQRRKSRKSIVSAPINTEIAGRPYQTRAIRSIASSFENDNKRKSLLAMATGTGKTRTAVALCDILLQSNWAKRILFLADRVALVNQAVKAFKTHLPDVPTINLVTEQVVDGRVFVSTYQTMMGLIDGKSSDIRKFGVGQFDLIIIDEAHRSVYQKYRSIFMYFDSYLLGLTATPRSEVDRDTYSLFDLEQGAPTDSYDFNKAVEDKFLVPFEAVSTALKFQREGIKYDDLSDEEKEQWDTLEWNDEGKTPDAVSSAEVNRRLFNEDTVDKVIADFMQKGIKVAYGQRLGKTILFAMNQKHAEFIEERFNKAYPHFKGDFARVITFKTEYAQSLIDDFSEKESMPHIAISVDMLDTGIDVPEVVNLVVFKLIRSKTKFHQMIGRGTRLCEDLLGPGNHKENFRIFDYCQNFEFFNQQQETKEPGQVVTLAQQLFRLKLRLIKTIDTEIEISDDPNPFLGELRSKNKEALQSVIMGLNLDSFQVRPKRRLIEVYRKDEAWDQINDEKIDEVTDNLADLPSAVSDPDEMAKLFDVLCLQLQLCILNAEDGFEEKSKKINKLAEQLLTQSHIPAIKKEESLLLEIVAEGFWPCISIKKIEIIRLRLRGLIKLLEKAGQNIVYTNFEDEISFGKPITLPDLGLDDVALKNKVKAVLEQAEGHIAVQKLKFNKQITPVDVSELEKLLSSLGAENSDLLDKMKNRHESIGLFVRSIVGLDRSAVQTAFSIFLEGRVISDKQHRFMDLIIDYLTKTGNVPLNALYENPFSNIAAPEELFKENDIETIISILEEVKKTAVA